MKSANSRGAPFPASYVPGAPPIEVTPDSLRTWITRELSAIAGTIETLRQASPQVATEAPSRPEAGMIRLAKGGWNPTSNASYDASVGVLVKYQGGAWKEV